MIPLQIAGLMLAGRTLLPAYSKKALQVKRPLRFKLTPRTKNKHDINTVSKRRPYFGSNLLTRRTASKTAPMSNPLQILFKEVSSTLSQITRKNEREDYSAIIREFMPENAELLLPQYPINSQRIQFADIDGDSEDELIASYKVADDINTIILKKQNERWFKKAEINHHDYGILNYRGTADVTGEGRKQLLVGLASKEKEAVLYGYSFENGNANKLFARSYYKFDLIGPARNKKTAPKARLAVWNKSDADRYDIQILEWNETELKSLDNNASYYYSSVVPYYAKKVRQSPHNARNWYNLADALEKSGLYDDALAALKIGMEQTSASPAVEEFSELKRKVMEKINQL